MLDFSRLKIFTILSVCLTFFWMALPNALTPEQRKLFPEGTLGEKLSLGLDLRGGSHLLLELGVESYIAEKMEHLRGDLRTTLREQKIGFTDLAAANDAVSFTLLRETLGEHTLGGLVRKLGEGFDYSEDGDRVRVFFSERELSKKRVELLEQSIEIVNRRVNELGTTEPSIARQGDNRILVQVPGLKNPEQLKRILGKTARMTFHLVNTSVPMNGAMPLGTKLLYGDGKDGDAEQGYPVYARAELSGEQLTGANVTYDNGQPAVAFTLDTQGARIFGNITRANVGKPFAIVLDGKVITAPVIRSPILGGSGIITGNYTVESANDLAVLLRAGALPAPLTIVEERTVGPSLGEDSIAAGKKAALIGLLFVMVFMVLFYGLFGVFADIAMLVNLVMTVGVMSLLQATLTLPGIAGIVLTLGMAVDTNVLIYERMREEAKRGRTLYASIEQGFRAAFGTIIDSHVTGLIACAILFFFGTGTVRGFAVTLAIGISFSLFSAILLTRLMVVTWLRRTRPNALPI
jgi:protein-export membrane protein SecD